MSVLLQIYFWAASEDIIWCKHKSIHSAVILNQNNRLVDNDPTCGENADNVAYRLKQKKEYERVREKLY